MRVGILGIQHESNTLSARRPRWKISGERRCCAARRFAKFAGGHHEVGGYFEGLAAERIDAVPIFLARAMPAARSRPRRSMSCCGCCGAARSRGQTGWHPRRRSRRRRQRTRAQHGRPLAHAGAAAVGPTMPIVNTLDPHANVSPRMVDACDTSIAYRTNPHLDQRRRGLRSRSADGPRPRGEVSGRTSRFDAADRDQHRAAARSAHTRVRNSSARPRRSGRRPACFRSA